ncbi:sporulation integral membrane protein YtvI [Chungangia koreensis]|uniref:Sporulation integral membrane protein YtvI n=1 Tax=Chungangia koreensis TaxID=752657 RepID=A0ABV8X2J6_9LACT
MAKWVTKRNIIILSSIILFALFLLFILPISIPIVLALFVAFLMEPLVEVTMKRYKLTRKISVIVLFSLFLAIISMFFYFAITQMIGKIIQLTKTAPDYFNKLTGVWIDIQNTLFNFTEGLPIEIVESIQSELDRLLISIRDSLLAILDYETVTSLLTSIPNLFISFIFFLIALFLFMLELNELKKMFFRHLTTETAEKMRFMITRLNKVIFGFLKAQLLVSLIILSVTLVGLFFITPKYAIVMSFIIILIDVLPILGSTMVLAPWAAYQFISGDAAFGTKLAILAIILSLIRRVIEPKVMGSHIGLSPLATLISMFIGLKLFGLIGLFLGPFVVIVFTTAREAGIIKMNFRV